MLRAVVLASLFVACGGGGEKVDAGPPDACTGATTCSDPCNQGNELGVGRYCTSGHGECNQNGQVGGFIFCTKDYEPNETVQYCTGPCKSDVECGTGAYCSGAGQGGRGCVPATCGGTPSPLVDAGVDATTVDAT